MKHFRMDDMVKGWFVGGFSPTAFNTEDCEVGFKSYKAGDHESAHYHKVATELTVIVSGRVRMMGKEWGPGDIIVVEPGEATDFEALTDATNIVVKLPGALNDKYIV